MNLRLVSHSALDTDPLKNLLLVWVEVRHEGREGWVLGEGRYEAGEVLLKVEGVQGIAGLWKRGRIKVMEGSF